MGFTSTWIEFLYAPPHDDGVIHSDNVYYADWAKIIFQFGGKGSTMRWWKSDSGDESKHQRRASLFYT